MDVVFMPSPQSESPRPLHANPPSPASDTPMLNPLHGGPADPQYPSLIPPREACPPPVRDERQGGPRLPVVMTLAASSRCRTSRYRLDPHLKGRYGAQARMNISRK